MTKTLVTSIGADAYFEDYPLLVLFNEEAPDELKDICILHHFLTEPTQKTLQAGRKVLFDKEEYVITKVGTVAFENFKTLGHLSLNFGLELAEEILPGAIAFDRSEVPKIGENSIIQFID